METKSSEIDVLQPRRRYYREKDDVETCPECGTGLKKERCILLISAKSDTDQGEFSSNLPGGHFCKNCPVVVFDTDSVIFAAELGLRGNSNVKCSVVGLIDLESIPMDKRHLEIGSDDNPVPLVEFLPDLNSGSSSVIKKTRGNSFSANLNSPSKRRNKKAGRNDPCPCGSGIKYKKCCGK